MSPYSMKRAILERIAHNAYMRELAHDSLVHPRTRAEKESARCDHIHYNAALNELLDLAYSFGFGDEAEKRIQANEELARWCMEWSENDG